MFEQPSGMFFSLWSIDTAPLWKLWESLYHRILGGVASTWVESMFLLQDDIGLRLRTATVSLRNKEDEMKKWYVCL